jgi:hypothetical protein
LGLPLAEEDRFVGVVTREDADEGVAEDSLDCGLDDVGVARGGVCGD